jgi:hypothetical protein
MRSKLEAKFSQLDGRLPHQLNIMEYLEFHKRNFQLVYQKKIRLLCLTEGIYSPALWSHYGDSHSGIALEFELQNNDSFLRQCFRKVRYLRTMQSMTTVIYLRHILSFPLEDSLRLGAPIISQSKLKRLGINEEEQIALHTYIEEGKLEIHQRILGCFYQTLAA